MIDLFVVSLAIISINNDTATTRRKARRKIMLKPKALTQVLNQAKYWWCWTIHMYYFKIMKEHCSPILDMVIKMHALHLPSPVIFGQHTINIEKMRFVTVVWNLYCYNANRAMWLLLKWLICYCVYMQRIRLAWDYFEARQRLLRII